MKEKYKIAKCPFRFTKCDEDCALRVKVITYKENMIIEGQACSLAMNSCTVDDVSIVARFVSESKITTIEDMSDENEG